MPAVIPASGFDRHLRTAHRRLAAALAIVLAASSGAAFPAPGDLDLTFAGDGVLFVDATGRHDRVNALVALPDGSLLAAGSFDHGLPTHSDMTLLKLTPGGGPDTSFGVAADGLAEVALGGDQDVANALLVQPDGRIVVAGALEPGANTDFGVARFDADGVLDTSFGDVDPNGGRLGYVRVNVGTSSGANDYATVIARQRVGGNAGKLVVAGSGLSNDGANCCYRRFGLVRLTADGSVDTSFGPQEAPTGIVVAPPSALGAAEYPTGIATRADGSMPGDTITVVGYVFPDVRALIRRYTANGLPDTSFDGDGLLVIEDTLQNSQATGMGRIDAAVYQPDGKLLVVGRARDRGFTFMRFHANGARDTSFGVNGRVSIKYSETSYYDTPSALVLQSDGKIIAAGQFSAIYDGERSNDFAVVRLLTDGTPDPAFGDGGWSTYPLVLDADIAHAVAIGPKGEITAAGYAQRTGASTLQDDMAFLRLEGDTGIFADGFDGD